MLSSVVCSWSIVARVRTSAGDGRRVEGVFSIRSFGNGEGEPRETNQRVAEQRGSARCSRTQSV